MAEASPPLPIGEYFPDGEAAQTPADVVVQMNTILRPCLERAVESVYAQTFRGRVQLAVGVDVVRGDPQLLRDLLARRPANVSALVVELPYSTSVRHGGVHTPFEGGALRAILSLASNGRYLTYLDDDNQWSPHHLEVLFQAVQGKAYAFSRRMLVDERDDTDLGVDIWDSVGFGKGRLASRGGHVDPNCLIVDKARLAHRLAAWAQTPDARPGFLADRNFFQSIAQEEHAATEEVTVRYGIRPTNVLHLFLQLGSTDPQAMAQLEARIAELRKPQPTFVDGAGGLGR
jgi:hypothetical protein